MAANSPTDCGQETPGQQLVHKRPNHWKMYMTMLCAIDSCIKQLADAMAQAEDVYIETDPVEWPEQLQVVKGGLYDQKYRNCQEDG